MKKYTIGIDFGTLSVRAVMIDATNGVEIAESTFEYPHKVLDSHLPSGKKLAHASAFQHPKDYLDGLQATVKEVISLSGISPEEVCGVAIDFTSCTVLPIKKDGTPLCFDEKYADEPHAYVKLWKHHSAQPEADKINELAKARNEAWLKIYGGKLSSEFLLPKVFETLNNAPSVYDEAYTFMEAGDWLSLILTGKETRSISFAGFKAAWVHGSGYPSEDFLAALDPRLRTLFTEKIDPRVTPITEDAGVLNAYGAKLLGLMEGTPLSLPIIDAQSGVPALGVTNTGEVALILGTSGCFIWHEEKELDIPGLLGYCYNAIVPEYYTYEAGQACLGDGFDWFVKNCVPASYENEAKEKGIGIHQLLREKAIKLDVGESGVIALDWLNGNRSVLCDSQLSGMILGITLTTKPEEIYRALIEATAFSTKMIIDTAEAYGSSIKTLCASGGIALKDEMMMQIYADVLGREIKVSSAKQAGAYGSAVRAAVSAGIYSDIFKACEALAKPIKKIYRPSPTNHAKYLKLYEEYKTLHDYFGKGQNNVMKNLRNIGKN